MIPTVTARKFSFTVVALGRVEGTSIFFPLSSLCLRRLPAGRPGSIPSGSTPARRRPSPRRAWPTATSPSHPSPIPSAASASSSSPPWSPSPTVPSPLYPTPARVHTSGRGGTSSCLCLFATHVHPRPGREEGGGGIPRNRLPACSPSDSSQSQWDSSAVKDDLSLSFLAFSFGLRDNGTRAKRHPLFPFYNEQPVSQVFFTAKTKQPCYSPSDCHLIPSTSRIQPTTMRRLAFQSINILPPPGHPPSAPPAGFTQQADLFLHTLFAVLRDLAALAPSGNAPVRASRPLRLSAAGKYYRRSTERTLWKEESSASRID